MTFREMRGSCCSIYITLHGQAAVYRIVLLNVYGTHCTKLYSVQSCWRICARLVKDQPAEKLENQRRNRTRKCMVVILLTYLHTYLLTLGTYKTTSSVYRPTYVRARKRCKITCFFAVV